MPCHPDICLGRISMHVKFLFFILQAKDWLLTKNFTFSLAESWCQYPSARELGKCWEACDHQWPENRGEEAEALQVQEEEDQEELWQKDQGITKSLIFSLVIYKRETSKRLMNARWVSNKIFAILCCSTPAGRPWQTPSRGCEVGSPRWMTATCSGQGSSSK